MDPVRKPSFLKAVKAVMWSFFGVRKGRDHQADLAGLSPLHLIAAGVLCGAAFIALLIAVVHAVLAK
jgi:Protein of unknown function (DUF2970)